MTKKILLTGATGYIGKRLFYSLLDKGYNIVCCTRDKSRFDLATGNKSDQVEVIEVDFLEKDSLTSIPKDIDGAYYLMHSMSNSKDYRELERQSAENFVSSVNATNCEHVVYLSGMVNSENLSEHLSSRKMVEDILHAGNYHCTTLRAGIIIGSGSASFEIIRDLVEKLPVMVTPKWLKTKTQPIGIANVLEFLSETLFLETAYDTNFDIAGPEVMTYKEMLLGYAEARGLQRYIWTLPVMTPRMSSYWLYFVTSTNFKLAQALVDSMKIDVVARDNKINSLTGVKTLTYKEALKRTLSKIEAEEIVSSWKDSYISSLPEASLKQFATVPTFGSFVDERQQKITDKKTTLDRIWRIGGDTGWYKANLLWQFRGFLDKLFGGVGLRRGRTHPSELHPGDALDFWRVLYANKEEGRLLLFAEMKLPGEAWLQFEVKNQNIIQKAVFRPKGLLGRLYWYLVMPFHGLVFKGMINKLAE